MELSQKETGFARPVLTVVKSNQMLAVRTEELSGDKKKADEKMKMPEQRHGYIKVRKHDCL